MTDVIELVRSRRDYFAAKDLYSGWSGNESGPCCDKCRMTNPKDPLQALVGCRNPFQMESVCQCHIPVRLAVRHGIVEAHNQLIRALDEANKRRES